MTIGDRNPAVAAEHELDDDQLDAFEEKGYLHLEGVFSGAELELLEDETQRLLRKYALSTGEDFFDRAFEGEERIDREEMTGLDLKVLYHLEGYSRLFRELVFDGRLVTPMTQLIGPNVELHQTSLHAKPPESGSPFPMHQDSQFFRHERYDYVDAMVHLGDAPSERGPLQFIEGTHKRGPIEHRYNEGQKYLSPEEWPFEDAVEVPAEAGDVVLFHIHTVHGSDVNRSDRFRPIMRVGYRDPEANQLDGIGTDKMPVVVAGRREADDRVPGDY